MRTTVIVKNVRRVLCVFPAYAPSFGTFSHAYKLMPGVRAFMPPQGLLLIAAYMPAEWPVRFIDENISPASASDFEMGGRGAREWDAHPGAADPRHPRPRQGDRQGRGAGRAIGVRIAGILPGHRIAALG